MLREVTTFEFFVVVTSGTKMYILYTLTVQVRSKHNNLTYLSRENLVAILRM
jgi:hypothetical protein